MTQQAADNWVKKYLQPLPVIPLYKQQALSLISTSHYDKTELSQIMAKDPGFSSQLLNKVNSKRKNSKREYLESIQSALSLLGDQAIKEFVTRTESLDDVRTSFTCVEDYLTLVARAHHAATHAKQWASNRNSQGIKEVGIATKLYDIAEYVLCLFDHEHYLSFKNELYKAQNPNLSSESILGFSLNELAKNLCDTLHFPELIKEAHGFLNSVGMRTQGIKLAIQLSKQADFDWYNQAMQDCLIKIADHCQLSLQKTIDMVHQTSIESARHIDFAINFHAAANLVLHAPMQRLEAKDTVREHSQAASETKPITKESPKAKLPEDLVPLLINSIKKVAQSPNSSQAELLTTLLKGLHDHLKIKRNALLLLNKDRTQLNTRLHSGLEANSKLLKISLITAQSGLLKKLLEKPQAVWINPQNFKKYEKTLPGLFKSCNLSDDFFLMSLFSGNKPVAIVYADNQSNSALTQQQFTHFKQILTLSAKAMVIIAKRGQKKSSN